jgi:hypothetical protein
MPDHAFGCAATQRIKRAPMTGSGHGYEVGLELDGRVNNGFNDAPFSEHDWRQMRGL